jgi:hypothetical protein
MPTDSSLTFAAGERHQQGPPDHPYFIGIDRTAHHVVIQYRALR